MSKSKLHIAIPSRTERLIDVRTFIANAAMVYGFGEEDVNNITLAVDEACTNIIKHAYNFDANKNIDVDVVLNGNKFEIVISDNGKFFDPDAVPTPNMKEYIAQHRRGGLGMYLMKRVMDSVEFSFQANRNTLRMVKHLHS